MKKVYIFEDKEKTELKQVLRNINHSLGVMEQNLDHAECIKENIDIISKNLVKAFALTKTND